MKKQTQKPEMYLFTGHRKAGKTRLKESMLQDSDRYLHFLEHNLLLAELENKQTSNGRASNYGRELNQFHNRMESNIFQQFAQGANICIELGAGSWNDFNDFQDYAHTFKYQLHLVFVLNDHPQQSFQRLTAEEPHLSPHLRQEMQEDYRLGSEAINNCLDPRVHKAYLYDSSEPNKLLACFEKGKLIFALPEVLEKEWLSAARILRKKLKTHLNIQAEVQISPLSKQPAACKDPIPQKKRRMKL